MAKHNLKEFTMKRFCSIHNSGEKSQHYNNLQAFFLETKIYLPTSVRLCSSIVKRANLWSGSPSSLLFGRQVEGDCPIHSLYTSSACSPESGLLSDWLKNKRYFGWLQATYRTSGAIRYGLIFISQDCH